MKSSLAAAAAALLASMAPATAHGADAPRLAGELAIAPTMTFGYTRYDGPGIDFGRGAPPALVLEESSLMLGGAVAVRVRYVLDARNAVGIEARAGYAAQAATIGKLPHTSLGGALDGRGYLTFDRSFVDGGPLRWTVGAGFAATAFTGSQLALGAVDNVISTDPVVGPAAMGGLVYECSPEDRAGLVVGTRVHAALQPQRSQVYVPVTLSVDIGYRF